jgi:hypothetical protein
MSLAESLLLESLESRLVLPSLPALRRPAVAVSDLESWYVGDARLTDDHGSRDLATSPRF